MSEVCLGNLEGWSSPLTVKIGGKETGYGHWLGDKHGPVHSFYKLGTAKELKDEDLIRSFRKRTKNQIPHGYICEIHLRDLIHEIHPTIEGIAGTAYGVSIPESAVKTFPVGFKQNSTKLLAPALEIVIGENHINGLVSEKILRDKVPGLVWYVENGFGKF